jgi:hypothetical protein
MSMDHGSGRALVEADVRTRRCRDDIRVGGRCGVAERDSDLAAQNSVDGGFIAVRRLGMVSDPAQIPKRKKTQVWKEHQR